MWMEIIIKTCNHPSLIGTAKYILYVGRKQK